MTTYTISSGHDTWANVARAPFNYGDQPVVGVTNGGLAYIYVPIPAELVGSTVSSATLTGHSAGTYAGLTITANLISSSWSTGTLTWNNMPTASAGSVATAVGSATVGGAVVMDVGTLMQAVASGAAWYGIRLSAPYPGFAFASFDSGLPAWTLTIVVSDAPEVPQALVPNGTTVSQSKPTLTCDFTDNGGLSTDMAAINVQIDAAQNSVSPGFDSGTVLATIPLLDLTTTAYAGIGTGSTTYWRVRVRDGSGLWSGWSDWAGMTYQPKGALTINTPAAGVLWDPTSDIIASTSANMASYRVQITSGTDRTDVRYDSGRLPANPAALRSIVVTLPEEYEGSRVLVDDRNYQLHVRYWDTLTNRQATPGAPTYVESWSTFHFDDDLTQTPIATLIAVQPDPAFPPVRLTWTRAAAPDGWIVLRDRQVIAKLAPADVISGVSTYTWTDKHPQPWVEHIYDVRPTTTISGVSKRAPAGPRASITPDVHGIHIYTSDGDHLVIDGGDTSQLVMADRLSTYKPVNLRYDVDVVTSHEGLSGTFVGGVIPSALQDQTATEARAVIDSIKAKPSTPVKMVYGLFSGRVLLRNISVTPDARGNVAAPVLTVSFGVNQVADF